MKKTASFYLIFMALLMSQSCGDFVLKTQISDKKFEPTDPMKLELYYTKIPNREYEEIAFAYGNSYKDLRREAAKLGANAILQVRVDRGYKGIAVHWK